ncbi:Zinc finger, C4 type [Aphelenchoides besseyi]|nr:Zinc finger, C4 type [Aphelenchoides besseyi]
MIDANGALRASTANIEFSSNGIVGHGMNTTDGDFYVQHPNQNLQQNCAPSTQHPFQAPPTSASYFPSNGQQAQSNGNSSSSTPDRTPPMSLHGSQHGLHRTGSSSSDLSLHKLHRVKSTETCRVCGDTPARPHYGVHTCFGCKGFFRRTLKRTKEYTCRYQGNCVVDRYERNSCRYCRFKRCLDVGMDPKAVRPDRDAAGRSHPIRHRRSRVSFGEVDPLDVDDDPTDEWVRKLPVDMRTLLMQIMNIDLVVNSGDTHKDPMETYPLRNVSLTKILADPTLLDGKRTEMRYEPYRRVKAEEMVAVAHRRMVAVIDQVDALCALMDLHNTHDKLALVKSAYAPLALFCTIAATAKLTRDRNVFCLCVCGYIARGTASRNFEEPYHFTNRIVERALDELVEPFRAFNFKEQEIALMKAIVTLNPHIRTLSAEGAELVADMRDRVQETLYNVVRESHPKEVASSRFGNLLLFLPNIMLLGTTMYENLQFMQSFSQRQVDPLLAELLDNLEPIQEGALNPEDMLSMFDNDNSNRIKNSESTSSLSSMGSSSHESYVGGNNGLPEQYYARRQSADPSFPMSSSAPTNMCGSVTNGMNQQDSDPDYNVTLTAQTAESFSGMRQAIAQSMEIDPDQSLSDFYTNQPPTASQSNQEHQKPRFYIDSFNQPTQQSQQPTHATIAPRHVFTVEANKDPLYSIAATNTAFQQALEMNPPPASSISKSQSYPYALQQQMIFNDTTYPTFQQIQGYQQEQNNYGAYSSGC